MKCRECSRELELKSKKNRDTGTYYQEWECIACGKIDDPTGMKGVPKNHAVADIDDICDAFVYTAPGGGTTKATYVPGYGFKITEENSESNFTIADRFKKGRT